MIAVRSIFEVRYPRLELPDFSSRLHYSGKLRMRASQPGSIIAASFACEVQHPHHESSSFSGRLHHSGKLRILSQQHPDYLQPLNIFVALPSIVPCYACPTYSLTAYTSASRLPGSRKRSRYATLTYSLTAYPATIPLSGY
ncbi:unnamed protein product [Lactuca saligna]|uniref:Uncharacterized protein n=1 Tax=Lactuca saligna TaxID=75948 RepID=A0AA35YET1_LACSI|nr:unnamed protein product [Lactuca saligna]